MGPTDNRTKYLLLCLASEPHGIRRDRFLDELNVRAKNLFGSEERFRAPKRMPIFESLVQSGLIKQREKSVGRSAYIITQEGEAEKQRLWEESIRPERTSANIIGEMPVCAP